jgi:hypothetical protein
MLLPGFQGLSAAEPDAGEEAGRGDPECVDEVAGELAHGVEHRAAQRSADIPWRNDRARSARAPSDRWPG